MFDSEYDSDLRLMLHRGTGEVTIEQLIAATRLWFTHPEFDPQTAVVWDIREAFLNLSIADLSSMYPLIRAAVENKRTGGRTAWVVSSRIVASIVLVVRNEFDWGSEWRTFEDPALAFDWCNAAATPA